MRVCKMFVRALGGLVIAGGMWVGSAQAQTVTVSPTDLSFGVPTGTSGAVSAPQTVTVNIQGQGSVTFNGATTGNGDFAVNGNSCMGALTAPTTCQVSVVFTASQPAGTLESTTLTISSTATPGTLSVPMNGALGAIEIFGALNINNSLFAGTTWKNNPPTAGNPVSTNTIALSCAATLPAIVAKLSSTPDGTKNVFQDNTLRIIDTPNGGNTANTPNVCLNGDPTFQGFTGFPPGTTNCFQQAYENTATNYIGQNPDLAIAGQGGPGSFIAQYGVPAIDISSFLVSGNQSLTVELDDAGGELGAAALHLVTNCTLAGTVPGGSITGNPVSNADPSSQTQTFTFDNGGGQNIGFTTSTSTAQQQGTVTIPNGTVPIVTDIGIPQNLFSQLVKNKSAAPAVCLRLTGETDPFGQPMCKGYLIQCQSPGSNGTVSGDNCVPDASAARNLLDIARFESPDAPAGQSYLTNTQHLPTDPNGPVSACGSFASSCPQTIIGPDASSTMLVGPGMLLGSDGWLCAPGTASGDLSTCTSLELTTQTTNTGTNYSAANCSLTGSLTGNICPLDTLTEFLGAADPVHGSTTSGKNSIFVPVVNMPLPFTTLATSTMINGNGWVNTTAATVTFTSHPANYSAAAPLPNGFAPAPTYSVTYGVTPYTSPIPDTTYPVNGDLTQYNPGASPNFGKLTPGQSICASVASPSFTSLPVTLASTEGVYNLHYFTTDCALSEELLFNPQGMQLTDPTANWASFRTLAFGVDNSAPVLAACTLTPSAPNGSNGWYTTGVSASCSASDDLSGFAPGSPVANTNGAVLQGSPSGTQTGSTSGTGATAQIPAITINDLAGNVSNAQGPFATPIDNTAPTFSAKFNVSGTNFTVGQNVIGTFTCADAGGSGVATCGTQTVSVCSGTPGIGLASFNTPVTIDTSAAAVGSHTVRAVDCAGNPSSTSVTYNVALGSVELAIANIPNPLASVKSGSNLTYKIFVLDLSANTASNVVVTDTLPANTTFVSAVSGIVSCTLAGCNDLTTGSSCGVSGSVVTCTTPTVKPILPGLTGFVIKLVVKVTAPATVKSITDTATVSAANPDPIKGDNTVSVTTKVTQ
jgi:uncharacterized repeat protein (TIGR01451 family)